MLATRNKEYNEYKFKDGKQIFVKDMDKKLWVGPVRVQHQQGNNVAVITDGRVTSAPIKRTLPIGGIKDLKDSIEENEHEKEDTSESEKLRKMNTKKNKWIKTKERIKGTVQSKR